MKRLAPILCMALTALGAWSQGRAQHDDVALEPSPLQATRLRWPQYAMISGRVVASSSQPTNITVPLSTTLEGRRRERLVLNLNASATNLEYELTTPKEQFSLAIVNSSQLVLDRAARDGKFNFHFEQVPGRALLLTLDEPSGKRTWHADSFWHLFIAEPEIVRGQLIPLLEVVYPSWQLASLGSAIEEVLFQRAQSQQHPDRQRWAQLVNDLASPKFSDRQNAERELLKAGQVVVPYLQNLDRSQLDAEQSYRVRCLVEALAVGYEDTADRVVTWLAGDEQVWFSLLTRAEPEKRRAAAAQLAAIWGVAIEFNPDAPAAERKTQHERLRGRLRMPSSDKK